MRFNACVGDNTGTADNSIGYSRGFQKATEVLLAALGIGKPGAAAESWGQEPLVDLLVYPICYAARHHAELALKRLLSKSWKAYCVRFSSAQRLIGEPREAYGTHNLLKILDALSVVCEAADERLVEYCRLLSPYILDLDKVDSTGQVFRYDVDNASSRLHMDGLRRIDLAHFASGYASLCETIERFEHQMFTAQDELETGTFTTKLNRTQLLELATLLPDKTEWTGAEFEMTKGRFMSEHGLSGKDFQRAVDKILSSRWLSFRVGVSLPIKSLSKEVFERLRDASKRSSQDSEKLTLEERSALYGLLETGSHFAYPEVFESYLAPPPEDPERARSYELARDASYLSEKYARNPERIEHALAGLGQLELLKEFKEVYREYFDELRELRESHDLIDFNRIFARPPFQDP